VSEGKPGNSTHYSKHHFDNVTIYVSHSLPKKQITISLGRFLSWKWLKLKEQ